MGLPVFDKRIPIRTVRLKINGPYGAVLNVFQFRISKVILTVYQCFTEFADKYSRYLLHPVQFLCALATLWKSTITFVMSVRLYVATRLPLEGFSRDIGHSHIFHYALKLTFKRRKADCFI
jgi:hypothetical protein